MTRIIFRVLFPVLLSCCTGPIGLLAADRAKPNVILIVTDDQGYADMSCHGNPFLETPEIDRLHDDSVCLTDFHVDPTCSPTRAALMTGRYSTRVGVWLTYASRHHVRRDEVSMADVFRDNGYRTGIFGKWHLGDNYPFRPTDRGFDESLIHGGGMIGETPDGWNNDYYDDVYFRNNEPEQVEGYCTDVWFNEAMKFVDRSADQPFFLYLPTNAPHGPLHVPDRYTAAFRNKPGIPASRAYFYGMIACIDDNLGRLRKHLADRDLHRNTILIFLNDNGTGHGVTLTNGGRSDRSGWVESATKNAGFNAGLRGRKASAYEGGHRAACFVHWPDGNLSGGRDVDGLSAHLDLMPTLIDLCDLKPGREIAFDGTSLAGPIREQTKQIPSRTLFVHHQGRFGKPLGKGMPIHGKDYSVMKDQWRLVGNELYDLKADPGQRNNVATAYPQVASQLKAEYERWWDDLKQTFDQPTPFVIDPAHQHTVRISSQNFLGGYVAYSQHHVRSAMDIGDCWTWIDVEAPGQYEFAVRRWPHDIDAAMSETTPGHPIDPALHEADNKLMNVSSRAIAVSRVRLQVGEFDQTVDVPENAQEARFTVDLPRGLQTLQASLITADGKPMSAYYVDIEPVPPADKAQALFDGETLNGWHIMAAPEGDRYHATTDNFFAKDGAIHCRQFGNRHGGMLISDGNFGDFELELEFKCDWGCDSGLMLRCNEGGEGIQVMVDYLKTGCVGFPFGQGTGGFISRPIVLNEQDGDIVATDSYDAVDVDRLVYAIDADGWNAMWKPDAWNHLKVRCVGTEPRITTWINQVKVMEMDGSTYRGRGLKDEIAKNWDAAPAWNSQRIQDFTGNKGSIALQIHQGGRWAPDGYARYRSIVIRELAPK